MNLGIPQYKNCWKWRHSTYACRIQSSNCIKCNRLYKSKYHHHFTWYYKANFKTNSLRLKTKQGEPCLHFFKCSICKGNHQAYSNLCPFWKYKFNREWYSKKYQEICDNRSKLICLDMSCSQV